MKKPDKANVEHKPGNVVYCDYLHLNEARKDPLHSEPIYADKYQYLVLGKVRPVLIISKIEEYDGIIWYRICKITTKVKKHGQIRLGQLSEGKNISYLHKEFECYPNNLLSPDVLTEIPKLFLDGIIKNAIASKMGMPPL